MTGGALIGLFLLSMAWLFFVLGTLLNVLAWRAARRARPDETAPAGIPLLPGVVGSLAAFFSIPALARFGIETAWPWLWILLPLAIDVGCSAAARAARASRKTP